MPGSGLKQVGWYYLPARKSSLFIHGQCVDVVQEVANLFGRQRWRALGEVQFDVFQKQRFFSGKGVGSHWRGDVSSGFMPGSGLKQNLSCLPMAEVMFLPGLCPEVD